MMRSRLPPRRPRRHLSMRALAAFLFVIITYATCGSDASGQSERVGRSAQSPSVTVTTVVNLHKAAAENPYLETLVQGKDGNLYGTTKLGGTSDLGTVFRVTPAGQLTVLHSFGGPDGERPESGLVLAANGGFYGMTGGFETNYGTIFKVSRTGSLSTLLAFNNTNGSYPLGALVQGTDG